MKYILLLSLVTIFSCKRETETIPSLPSDSLLLTAFKDIVSTKEIKEGFNTPLQKDSIFIAKRLNDTLRLSQIIALSDEKQKIFTKNDSLYFLEQEKNIQNLSLNTTFFSVGKVFLTEERTIVKRASSANDNDFGFGYFEFSKPFISADHTKAVIQVSYYCPDCGYGIAVIFSKKDRKWVFTNEIPLWNN